MATRDNNYWQRGRQNSFVPARTNSLYGRFNNNFNLNQQSNPSSSSNQSISRTTSRTFAPRLPTYASNYNDGNNLQRRPINILKRSDNRSFSSSSNYLRNNYNNNVTNYNNRREYQNGPSNSSNNNSNSNSNNSTLSLHITAYENSNEGGGNSMNNKNDVGRSGESSRMSKNQKNVNALALPSSNTQNSLVIPRQPQKPDEIIKPETAQFKVSQRLLNVSNPSNQNNNNNQNESSNHTPTQSHDSYLPTSFTKGYNLRNQIEPSTGGYGPPPSLSTTTNPPSRILNVVIPKSRQQPHPLLALPGPSPSSTTPTTTTTATSSATKTYRNIATILSKSSSTIGLNALPRLPRPGGGPKIHFGGSGFPPPINRNTKAIVAAIHQKEEAASSPKKIISEKDIITWKGYKFQSSGNIEYKVCEETKQRLSNIKNSIIFSCILPPGFCGGNEYDPFGDDDDENEADPEKQQQDAASNWRKNKYKNYSKIVLMKNSINPFSSSSSSTGMTLEEYIKNIKIDYLKAEKKPDFNCDKKWSFDLRKRDEENFEDISDAFDNLILQAERSIGSTVALQTPAAAATTDYAEPSTTEDPRDAELERLLNSTARYFPRLGGPTAAAPSTSAAVVTGGGGNKRNATIPSSSSSSRTRRHPSGKFAAKSSPKKKHPIGSTGTKRTGAVPFIPPRNPNAYDPFEEILSNPEVPYFPNNRSNTYLARVTASRRRNNNIYANTTISSSSSTIRRHPTGKFAAASKSPPNKKPRRSATPGILRPRQFRHPQITSSATTTTTTTTSASSPQLFGITTAASTAKAAEMPKPPPKKKTKRNNDDETTATTATSSSSSSLSYSRSKATTTTSSSYSSTTSSSMKQPRKKMLLAIPEQQQQQSSSDLVPSQSSLTSQFVRPQRNRRPVTRYQA